MGWPTGRGPSAVSPVGNLPFGTTWRPTAPAIDRAIAGAAGAAARAPAALADVPTRRLRDGTTLTRRQRLLQFRGLVGVLDLQRPQSLACAHFELPVLLDLAAPRVLRACQQQETLDLEHFLGLSCVALCRRRVGVCGVGGGGVQGVWIGVSELVL